MSGVLRSYLYVCLSGGNARKHIGESEDKGSSRGRLCEGSPSKSVWTSRLVLRDWISTSCFQRLLKLVRCRHRHHFAVRPSAWIGEVSGDDEAAGGLIAGVMED